MQTKCYLHLINSWELHSDMLHRKSELLVSQQVDLFVVNLSLHRLVFGLVHNLASRC